MTSFLLYRGRTSCDVSHDDVITKHARSGRGFMYRRHAKVAKVVPMPPSHLNLKRCCTGLPGHGAARATTRCLCAIAGILFISRGGHRAGFTRWRVLRSRVTTDASLRHLSPVTYPPVGVSPTPGVTQHFRNFCVPAVHEARALLYAYVACLLLPCDQLQTEDCR